VLSNRNNGITDFFDGALKFVVRHMQMLCPTANRRRIVHGDVTSCVVVLDGWFADHFGCPKATNCSGASEGFASERASAFRTVA
jgi:hypothetical protein